MVTLLITGTIFFIYFYIIFILIEDILHVFPKVSNLARHIAKIQLKNYLTITTNNFMISKTLNKLNFTPPLYTEKQQLQLLNTA